MAPGDCATTFLNICFEPASAGASSQIFGIADFLATVAIFVAAYSLSDARYKFRTAASTISYRHVLFLATLLGGFGLLMSTMWFTLKLPIPQTINNPVFFQVAIAAILIATLATWMFRSFVRPVRFSKRNALPFAREVFLSITDGSEEQLSAAAQEVGVSASRIVTAASLREPQRNYRRGGFDFVRPIEAKIASDLLLLLGDRRFCRLVAQKKPWVAEAIFRAAAEPGSDLSSLNQFSRNVANEFFLDGNSAIHHEDDGFYSGMIGYVKPVSSALFANSSLIERLARSSGSPLEMLWLNSSDWGVRGWDTYGKAALLFLEDQFKDGHNWHHSTAVHQIFSGLENACNDIYLINEMDEASAYASLPYRKFDTIVDFVERVIDLLERNKVMADRMPDLVHGHPDGNDVYNLVAKLAFRLVVNAGSVNTPEFRNWSLQYNSLWSSLMREHTDSLEHKLFRTRLQRRIWVEVKKMSDMPNYVGARVLSICLNVMGLRMDHAIYKPANTRALKRLILGWVKANYLTLHKEYPNVARSSIGGTISFDSDNGRLIKTYSASLGGESVREYLQLDPAKVSPQTEGM